MSAVQTSGSDSESYDLDFEEETHTSIGGLGRHALYNAAVDDGCGMCVLLHVQVIEPGAGSDTPAELSRPGPPSPLDPITQCFS